MNLRKRIEALEGVVRPADVRGWFLFHHALACDQADAEALTAPETPRDRKRALLAAYGCPDASAIDAENITPMRPDMVLLQPAPGRVLDVVSESARTLTFGPWKVWL